jgi:hypothetical protein
VPANHLVPTRVPANHLVPTIRELSRQVAAARRGAPAAAAAGDVAGEQGSEDVRLMPWELRARAELERVLWPEGRGSQGGNGAGRSLLVVLPGDAEVSSAPMSSVAVTCCVRDRCLALYLRRAERAGGAARWHAGGLCKSVRKCSYVTV